MDNNLAETPDLPFGELFREPRHLRADLRLLRRAIREGWPIPEGSRRLLLDRVSGILQNPEAVHAGIRSRAVAAASEVFVEADLANLRAIQTALGSHTDTPPPPLGPPGG